MLTKELKEQLLKNRILARADGDVIDACFSEETVRIRHFGAGETLFSPNAESKCVGTVLSGTASAVPARSGDGAVLRLLCEGDTFGIANLYAEEEPFPSVITAKTATEILFVDFAAFRSLLERDVHAMRAYISFLNGRILYLNKKISALTVGGAEKKLAFFIAENECGGEFIPPASMSAVAELLNIGRASLYRALDALAASGLVVRDGKKILIPDKNALLSFI